ncbi:MAG: HAMP domain-containing histidine kinase [Saprospiraceae bacterium]|nr:HAMP domain-containing histidine kinase [Saprospiraceae bacterium]
MNQKALNIFLTGFILFGSVLSYHFYETSSFFDSNKEFRRNLDFNFKRDSMAVVATDFLVNAKKKQQMEKSGFTIEIVAGDSLVYWNQEKTAKTQEAGMRKMFRLDNLVYRFTLDKDEFKQRRSSFIDLLMFAVWLLGLTFFFIGLLTVSSLSSAWPDKLARSGATIIIFSGAFILLIPGYYAATYMFKDSVLFGALDTGTYGSFTLWQFALNWIAIAFLALFIQTGPVRLRRSGLKPGLRYFIGSLTISALIYFLIAVGELFILNGRLEIKIEEAMNFGITEVILYVLLISHLFLVVLVARQLFTAKDMVIRGWEKTIYFSTAVLLTTLIFILLGYETNTVGPVLFLMIMFLLLDLYFEYFEINISFLLSSVIAFSVFLTTVIYSISLMKTEREINNGFHLLYKELGQENTEILTGINDSIVNSELFPSLSNLPLPINLDVKDLKAYITNQLSPKSDLTIDNIYCYDKRGASLALNQISNKDKIDNLLAESELIGDHIYYSPIEKSALLYYHIDNVNDPANPIFMAIQFLLKEKPFPDLPYKASIAVYKGNHLVKIKGDIENSNYPTLLSQLQLNQTSKSIKFYSLKNYTFVSLAQRSFIARYLPLLTLFIALAGIMVLILIILNSIFHFIDERYHLSFNTRKSLRSRFQTTITGLVLFSFLLIGGTTAFYYHRLYSIKNSQGFHSLLAVLIKDIQNNIPEIDNASDDIRLEKVFRKLENVHELPLAFYDAHGLRVLESDSYVTAPERLLKSVIEKEIGGSGNLKVLSTVYAENKVLIPVYDSNNLVSGYFLTEDIHGAQSFSGLYDFLSTLLTICVFLFLTALALSMIVTTPMTKSLRNLSARLKDFKLGKSNEHLEWKNPDEIGALISNFNKMQVELNHSAALLSRTQRDLAWREMAKQVAHEIKNPLTPMKLSIQHMQNASQSDPEKMQFLIKKTAATILEQIENLTQIADEFSSFGTLPKASNDTIILNEVVEHIHDLFRKREDMDIQMAEPMNYIYVFADKNQLVRILNNIVKNATQSIPENTRGKIEIELSQNDHFAIIKVSDNGVGIPEDMKEKVFTPNFTTKSSGTGLGLAISANMIDSMNGKIYFNSPNEKNGTDFFIELPLVRNISGLYSEKMVPLE